MNVNGSLANMESMITSRNITISQMRGDKNEGGGIGLQRLVR